MKNKKSILLIIILMAVGFAAVSTTLYINGSTNINPNQDDFNVYYSDAYVNGTQDKSVITDDTHIVFETELSTLGEKYVLDYEVTNGSKNYDAELIMECTGDNEYLTVINNFDTDTILKAKALREGKLTLELTKSNAGEDVDVTISCTISANATERDSLGTADRSQITVEAVDSDDTNLNAKAFQILGNEEELLLDSLVETGYVSDASEVDALIEVKSDEFDDFATTTFDVSSIASEGDKVVILHFNEETQEWEYISEETVNSDGEVTADFTSYSPVAFIVVKDDGTYEIANIRYEIGDEITIAKEKFNVISQTNETVTMLAQYNLSTSYRQSTTNNYVKFSNSIGWEYTPGPKEVDIQVWSTNPKTYINNYVSYLITQTEDTTITGDLITLMQLKALDCVIHDDYTKTNIETCENSKYFDWVINTQRWWTKSAYPDENNAIWGVKPDGYYDDDPCTNSVNGIRPVITMSKRALSKN